MAGIDTADLYVRFDTDRRCSVNVRQYGNVQGITLSETETRDLINALERMEDHHVSSDA